MRLGQLRQLDILMRMCRTKYTLQGQSRICHLGQQILRTLGTFPYMCDSQCIYLGQFYKPFFTPCTLFTIKQT